MDDFLPRATIAYQRFQRLNREAQTCRDPERLEALFDEMEVITRNLEDIREEQLLAHLERNKPKPKRRWFGLRGPEKDTA